MNRLIKLLTISALLGTTSGCVSTLGQENFTCEGEDRVHANGVCAGPRDIYELTNNRDHLENLSAEELHRQLNKGNTTKAKQSVEPARHPMTKRIGKSENEVVYQERSLDQQNAHNYERPKVVPQTRFTRPKSSGFDSWPGNVEPLAPEALAVMSEPKPMRILVDSYTDQFGNFHVPGYLYVNTQKSEWKKAKATGLRPTRVVPLQMRQEADKDMESIERRRSGVSPLNVVTEQSKR